MLERIAFACLVVLATMAGACLSGCDEFSAYDDSGVNLHAGEWTEIRPYPGAPEGTRCFVWRRWVGESSIGGPECVVGGAR